jgi:NAD(P)-dependent dehydrogenase (short-subunit alcohol dehydrogenase family)
MPLADRTVLVVGGSSGIGLAIGCAFAREGCRVALAARSENGLAAARALPEVGGAFRTKTCDVGDRPQVEELFAWADLELGSLDILAFCAGTNTPRRAFADLDPREFDRILAVNATGAFNCLHAALPRMRARGAGLVFNVVSIAGLRAQALSGAPYCASKFAQGALGSFASLEAHSEGVRVTNIYPGDTDTPLLDQRPAPPPREARERMLRPDDVAEMVVAIAKLPPRAAVPQLVITPSANPFV